MALILLCNACLLPQYEDHKIGEFGHIVVRRGGPTMNGFVVAVTRGTTEPNAIEYAESITGATGAALVVAYGFKSKRIAVTQPLVHDTPVSWSPADSRRPGSIYPEFKKLLQTAADDALKFYVEFRMAGSSSSSEIEVASAGFSFEQLQALKHGYVAIMNDVIKDSRLSRVSFAIKPLDPISWNAFDIRNHGVLMLAKRGLVIQLPNTLAQPTISSAYLKIMARWVSQAFAIGQDRSFVSPRIERKQTPYGVIELIARRAQARGIVIGAPHGSFDGFTGDMVEALSYRTSLASVVARGFTPTECGGWRIDVNRPTELRYATDTIERTTDRAVKVYEEFKKTVLAASGGPLNLYIEVHQNPSEDDIMVATLGVTLDQAKIIKAAFRKIRDRVIPAGSPVKQVDLLIEPLDSVTIGAWAAKDHGILRLAKRSLHFEMPAERIFYHSAGRRAYTKILAELIDSITTMLLSPRSVSITSFKRTRGPGAISY